jgi:hypothetical protein
MAKRQTNDHDDLDLQRTQRPHDEVPYHSYPVPQTPQMPWGGRHLFSTGCNGSTSPPRRVRLPEEPDPLSEGQESFRLPSGTSSDAEYPT